MNANLSLSRAEGEYSAPAEFARPWGKTLPHNLSHNWLPCSVVALALALTAACAPPKALSPAVIAPEVLEKPVESGEQVEIAESEDAAIAYALEPEQRIVAVDGPGALTEQAKWAPMSQAASLLLPAIAKFIELGKLDSAQTQIEQLQAKPMSGLQQYTLILHQARLAQARGNHLQALELLRLLEQAPDISGETRVRLLLLRADSQQTLQRADEAVVTLLRRDELLEGTDRLANQRRILALLDSFDALGLLLLRESSFDKNLSGNDINGWIALSEALRPESLAERVREIERWSLLYREHPAQQLLLEQLFVEQPRLAGEPIPYRHIALLLPMTSPFGDAARAFYDGFMASRNQDHSPRQPAVSLHDIGDVVSLAPLYYQAAVDHGADFLVGPLGREAVNALLAASPSRLPALVIGDIPRDKTAPNLYGISLAPEHEAEQVADRAFAEGNRQAGIFRSDSQRGQRLADAFVRQWEALGGTVVVNKFLPRNVSAHPRSIQRFLGIDKSIKRQRILSAELGINLEFTPRRRDDIDFLFLAANVDQARLLAPQLRFFQAHDLPLYATSSVYDGMPNPAADADLDGIIFGEMNWILDAAVLPEPVPAPNSAGEAEEPLQNEPLLAEQIADTAALAQFAGNSDSDSPPVESAQTAAALRLQERRSNPYYHTELDRLYALGLESYRLIPRLETLRKDQQQRHFGKAVDISVKADGNAVLHLTWARFDHGLPVPLPKVAAGFPEAVPEQ